MAFKAAVVVHAPDGDPAKHRCSIKTGKYEMFAVVVSSQDQAIRECEALVRDEGVHSIMLCPGFTHKDIAEISEAVGGSVSVCVARGDGPGGRVVMEVMKREGWFPARSGD